MDSIKAGTVWPGCRSCPRGARGFDTTFPPLTPASLDHRSLHQQPGGSQCADGVVCFYAWTHFGPARWDEAALLGVGTTTLSLMFISVFSLGSAALYVIRHFDATPCVYRGAGACAGIGQGIVKQLRCGSCHGLGSLPTGVGRVGYRDKLTVYFGKWTNFNNFMCVC